MIREGVRRADGGRGEEEDRGAKEQSLHRVYRTRPTLCDEYEYEWSHSIPKASRSTERG
jgi:hypothetical protein